MTVARATDRASAIPAGVDVTTGARDPSGSPTDRRSRPTRSCRSSASAPCPASRRCGTARTCAPCGKRAEAHGGRDDASRRTTSTFASRPMGRPTSTGSASGLAGHSISMPTPRRSTPRSSRIRSSHRWSPGRPGSACPARSTASSSSSARSSASRCPSRERGPRSADSSRPPGRRSSGPSGGITHLFPTAERVAELPPEAFGMPRARAETIRRVAELVAPDELDLSGDSPRKRRSRGSVTCPGSDRGPSPTWRCARSATRTRSWPATSASARVRGTRSRVDAEGDPRASRSDGDPGARTPSCTSGTTTCEPRPFGRSRPTYNG